MEITPMHTEAECVDNSPPDPATAISNQDDTNYLLAIPGMRESILEGLNTPIDECDDAVEW